MCRKCEDCRARWKREWTGRLMAEHASSQHTWFVTLTYGGGYNNAAAYDLDRKHIDEFYQALRRRGYEFRPVAVGEYGGKNTRAHWHVLLFYKSEPPDVPLRRPGEKPKRFHWNFIDKKMQERWIWKHGLVSCELPQSAQACMAYIMKYLDKPADQRGEFSFGKRPALGLQYLVDRGRNIAKERLPLFPNGRPTYQVAGNVKDRGDTAGQPYDYWLDGQSTLLPKIIEAYVMRWRSLQPERLIPPCKWITAWAEGLTGAQRDALRPDVVRQHFSLHDKLLRTGKNIGTVTYTGEGDVTLLHCSLTGAMELRTTDHEGALTWRKSLRRSGSLEDQLENLRKGINLKDQWQQHLDPQECEKALSVLWPHHLTRAERSEKLSTLSTRSRQIVIVDSKVTRLV